jgi:hypothetical protein
LESTRKREDKVVYKDAHGDVRALYGRVGTSADPDFLLIHRNGGDISLRRKDVLEIRRAPDRGAEA